MLRSKDPRTVGIIVFDIKDPYCMAVLRGIEQYLNEQNFFYQLADVRNDLELVGRFLHEAKGRRIDGIIAISNAFTIEPSQLASALGSNMSFVFIGREVQGLETSTVLLDNEAGIRLGVEHLRELGHRRLACIIGPEETEDANARRDALLACCKKAGIPLDDALVEPVRQFPATASCGAAATRRLLARGEPFTALFAYDDVTAYGAIRELTARGLRVPQDISVVGFDDLWPSEMYNPPLTTIRQPMAEMGAAGAEMIVGILTKPKTTRGHTRQMTVMKPTLVVRETTAPPPRLAALRKKLGAIAPGIVP
jgi:LacI family transcriptional regulator